MYNKFYYYMQQQKTIIEEHTYLNPRLKNKKTRYTQLCNIHFIEAILTCIQTLLNRQ